MKSIRSFSILFVVIMTLMVITLSVDAKLHESVGAKKNGIHENSLVTANGTTTVVSIASDGTLANDHSTWPKTTSDGRYVVFSSHASNLIPNDNNNASDVFLYDRALETLKRISVSNNGEEGNHNSTIPDISTNGTHVVFASSASNLVSNDNNNKQDIFMYDIHTGVIDRVSVASDGTEGNDLSSYPSIDANGKFVVFESNASNFVANDNNNCGGGNCADVFLKDTQTNQVTLVSKNLSGEVANKSSHSPVISDDGRIVIFNSLASDMDIRDVNTYRDIYEYNRETDNVSLLNVHPSVGASNIAIGSIWYDTSYEGRYVVFITDSNILVPNDTNLHDAFVFDRDTEIVERVSVATDGTEGNQPADGLVGISDDGRYVVFTSYATNLIPNDTTLHWGDVYLRDRQENTTELVSVSSLGVQPPPGTNAYRAAISGDGTVIAFASASSYLDPLVNNGKDDIFVRDLKGETHRCSYADMDLQPLLLVTGWSGSVGKTTLSRDDQLQYFVNHTQFLGYVEGCNLFYATGTSPYLYQYQNAEVVQTNLCTYYGVVKQFNPNWDGHFDIIAHSYGGLRTRAYLENSSLYGQKCPGSNYTVRVDNLFTMGSPHGGEPYGGVSNVLPLAGLIGGCSLIPDIPPCSLAKDGEARQWAAIIEMLPIVRSVQNRNSTQPTDVCYHLLSGDATQQQSVKSHPLYKYWLNDDVRTTANDLAVHEASAHVLNEYSSQYPNLHLIYTDDVHGRIPLHNNIKSFVYPSTTFNQEILPYIGSKTCPVSSLKDAPTKQSSQPSTGVNTIEIASGVITETQVITGQFDLIGSGNSQIVMYWLDGDVELSLTDPLSNTITPSSTHSYSQTEYFSFDTGFGMMASYLMTTTVEGTWRYTVTANITETTTYRLFAIPSTPIGVSVSVPDWVANSSTVYITSTVMYSATSPITDSVIIGSVNRPDGTSVSFSMLDDGMHSDGAANDGIFGVVYIDTTQAGLYSVVLTATGVYSTESYNRNALAIFTVGSAGASLTNGYVDTAVDANTDNLYESLDVTTQISVTTPATYSLSGKLYVSGTFLSLAKSQLWLMTGTHSVTLSFNGYDIYSKQLDGPYEVSEIMLMEEFEVSPLLVEDKSNVYTTGFYDYEDFRPVPPQANYMLEIGSTPSEVVLTDLSEGLIDSWYWDFGDGVTSTIEHPVHLYSNVGQLNLINLTVTGSGGSDSESEMGVFRFVIEP